ncbi:hypothetical protein RRG08_000843 [Elysia crispata]|uniref:Uncharacterized protein n=1 Tax=Elysia crispata TaxID=231223 RepID=A0AAE1A443_9GAST|nr:hypothetical protein RRG08_000843 [Elysia crispata]
MSTDNQNKGVPKIQILHVLATIAAVISLALIACLLAAMVYVGDTGLLEASRLTSDSEFTRSEKESAENQLQVQLLNSPDPLEVSDDNDSRLEQQGTQRRSLLEMILEHNDQTSYVSRELVLDND